MILDVRRDGFKYYRWQAKRCRDLAERQTGADVRAQLMNTARQYDELADNVERAFP